MAIDLVANLFAHAQAVRQATQGNVTNICGFTYIVEGVYVIRRGPNDSFSRVWSKPEIEESLNGYQLSMLIQNRERRKRRAVLQRRSAMRLV